MSSTFSKPGRPLTCLITGCSSGLGLALARYVQTQGHKVIATSRQPSRTPDLVAEVESYGGEWHSLDLNDSNAAKILIESLELSNICIDVLINNAGSIIFGAVEQLADEELHDQMETLYFGPSRLIHALVPYMRQRRLGVVVNISSGAALDARESMGGYAAGKAALDASSRVLAKEVAPFNIRVLTVWLGTFNTNFGNVSRFARDSLPEDYRSSVAELTMDAIRSGKLPFDGDTDKAAKVIYEVATGEGVGAEREAERFLPLGRDMITRVGLVRDQYTHALEVFGEISGNVYIERKD